MDRSLSPRVTKRPDSLRVELLTIQENVLVDSYDNQDGSSYMKIGFRNVSYTVTQGLFHRERRKLLDKINGEFLGGELTAIMGPSGCGKTSLMNILSGYTRTGVTGDKLVNDLPRDEDAFRKNSCYIMQDDRLQPLLTIQEAMAVAADLKLKRSQKEKKDKIDEILASMNLTSHINTRIENLSGGQRKRLSIALELLNNPQVMFFDEPTSGLDSVTSKQCVALLKQLALTGRTVICTIHQPSATEFEMLDHLYVLSSGKCVYQGSVKGLLPYLEEVNLICPPYHNPADYLLEVASGEYGNYTESLCDKSENGMCQDWRKRQRNAMEMESLQHVENLMRSGKITPIHAPPVIFPKSITSDTTTASSINKRCPHCNCDKHSTSSKSGTGCCPRTKNNQPSSNYYQLWVLLKRNAFILIRDRTLTYSRLLTHLIIALIIGFLYYGIGVDASNMLNNFNFMFFTIMFLMMTAFNCITTTFPSEIPIITREYFNRWYSLKSYYIAISLADVPVQIVATLIYATTTYFMTHQPVEIYRIALFLFMCILISLVAQSFGLFIGACMETKNGVIFGPFCLLPFTIFSGFFVQLNSSHPYLRWLFHVSFLKYGLEGLILSVLGYGRPKLPCEKADYCHFVYPEKFLHQMDMDKAEYLAAVMFLIGLNFAIRVAAYYALKVQILYIRQKR